MLRHQRRVPLGLKGQIYTRGHEGSLFVVTASQFIALLTFLSAFSPLARSLFLLLPLSVPPSASLCRLCRRPRHSISYIFLDMGRKPKKMSPAADRMSSSSAEVAWRFTKIMNMRDLSRDDDYLSHLFVEKLGSLGSTSALLVHKMDPLRRLPKTDTGDILAIVQRVRFLHSVLCLSSLADRVLFYLLKLIRSKLSGSASIKQAVNELLE